MIVQADILKWAETYDGPLFHAALMDCPYEMEFMGRDWDNSGVSFNPETWKGIARHLHPGAFLFVMAGTINDDLISVAMRQAGLRKYHKAVYWSYGSGFPKSTRLDTVIDRRAGAERKVVGRRKHQPKFDAAGFEYRKKDNGYNSKDRESFNVTEPATKLAAAWAGHRYGGQVLKPSAETILIFQKPYQGAPVDCITRTGAGAINVEGGRIEGEAWKRSGSGVIPSGLTGIYGHRERVEQSGEGRWPANLILDEQAAVALDMQSGVSKSKRSQRGDVKIFSDDTKGTEGWTGASTERGHDDSGGASRYFYQSHWTYEVEEQIAAADPVHYCAKASKAEREAGLDPMQIKLLGMLDSFDETTVDDGRKTPIDNAYQRGETKRRNTHPCIKPLSLTSYLAGLLAPPIEYAPRRILIPFCGTGSEWLGAFLSGGWDEIVGVEIGEEYVRIAEARIAFWKAIRHRFNDSKIRINISADQPKDQLSLF